MDYNCNSRKYSKLYINNKINLPHNCKSNIRENYKNKCNDIDYYKNKYQCKQKYDDSVNKECKHSKKKCNSVNKECKHSKKKCNTVNKECKHSKKKCNSVNKECKHSVNRKIYNNYFYSNNI